MNMDEENFSSDVVEFAAPITGTYMIKGKSIYLKEGDSIKE